MRTFKCRVCGLAIDGESPSIVRAHQSSAHPELASARKLARQERAAGVAPEDDEPVMATDSEREDELLANVTAWFESAELLPRVYGRVLGYLHDRFATEPDAQP